MPADQVPRQSAPLTPGEYLTSARNATASRWPTGHRIIALGNSRRRRIEKKPAFTGDGVPSKLINDLLVTIGRNRLRRDGRRAGVEPGRRDNVEFSARQGFCGQDEGTGGWPAERLAGSDAPNNLLPEDYVTCLAADDRGLVWLGFRERGLLALNGDTQGEILALPPKAAGKADDLRRHPAVAGFSSLAGQLWRRPVARGGPRQSRHIRRAMPAGLPPDRPRWYDFPTPAAAPDLAELNGLLKEIESVPAARLTNGTVVALEDDWRTEGEWQGRYGRFWIVLCANWSPKNDFGVRAGT